ncbi:PIN domain-containing protein [Aminiphilus sp.]|jgi:uncharacterized protein YacL|uniref:PIN/TRAM domain-containing protein n=1 Tax=Aminiphilus sp. TaxID=1872488 RepID=UPI00260583AA|nr:PIN domain-containing protein [Aminiphilus sp.]
MEHGLVVILRGVVRTLLSFLGGFAGYQLAQYLRDQVFQEIPLLRNYWPWGNFSANIAFLGFLIILMAGIGYLATPLFLRALLRFGLLFESQLQSISWTDLTVGIVGLIIGLLVANLLALPFADFPGVGSYIAVLLNVVLGYTFVRIFLKRREDIVNMVSTVGELKGRILPKVRRIRGGKEEKEITLSSDGMDVKILDTSVAIDGRILDVASTGFLEGILVLPRFVLTELQGVADSSDPTRRTRGRRGLDAVNELQKLATLRVEILEISLKELQVDSVDQGLVALAKQISGKIITTDYNLNKIAQIQGISVLNVNDLANALKPMLLPGESVTVDLIREGKEPHQGVGYLDDGTMIVVEEGDRYVGRRVDVVVTSMLQTSAGRMVFGRLRRDSHL